MVDIQDFWNTSQGDIDEFVNSAAVRRARALIGIVKGLIDVGVCSCVLFFTSFFMRFDEIDDGIIRVFLGGMKALLILFIIMGALLFVRSLLILILDLTGNSSAGAGHTLIVIVGALEANAGRVFRIIFGMILLAFTFFAFTQGPDMLAEGSTVEGLYIVSGIFALAGLGLIISAIIGIVKSVKYYLSGGAA